MDVTVSSRHSEVSPALRATAVEKVGRLGRFLDGMDRAEVHFSEERNPRIAEREVCEVTMDGPGHVVRVKVAGRDQLMALDVAVEKLERRLSRLHRRLVERHRPRHATGLGGADTVPEDVAVLVPDEVDVDVDAEDGERPVRIVKTKRFSLQPMTADEAAVAMDLLDHEFYLFANIDTGEPAVVYRRDDGDVGLIEQAG